MFIIKWRAHHSILVLKKTKIPFCFKFRGRPFWHCGPFRSCRQDFRLCCWIEEFHRKGQPGRQEVGVRQHLRIRLKAPFVVVRCRQSVAVAVVGSSWNQPRKRHDCGSCCKDPWPDCWTLSCWWPWRNCCRDRCRARRVRWKGKVTGSTQRARPLDCWRCLTTSGQSCGYWWLCAASPWATWCCNRHRNGCRSFAVVVGAGQCCWASGSSFCWRLASKSVRRTLPLLAEVI